MNKLATEKEVKKPAVNSHFPSEFRTNRDGCYVYVDHLALYSVYMQIPSNQAKEVRSEKSWQLTLQRARLNIYYEKPF